RGRITLGRDALRERGEGESESESERGETKGLHRGAHSNGRHDRTQRPSLRLRLERATAGQRKRRQKALQWAAWWAIRTDKANRASDRIVFAFDSDMVDFVCVTSSGREVAFTL